MNQQSFKIKGMDCAEEIALLKREMSPLVGGEENLSFDLLNGKMIVRYSDPSITTDTILAAVRRTGLEAVIWPTSRSKEKDEPAHYSKQSRFCWLSAFFILCGFITHVWKSGWVNALIHQEGQSSSPPFFTLVCYAAAIVIGGWFIFPKAIHAAKSLRPDMNLLMTIAVVGAVIIGEWFEAATVTFLFALSLLLESWSINRARLAIRSLMDISPDTAHFMSTQQGILDKPVEEIQVGDRVLVRPGERIPVDGIVINGTTQVNQAPITGESIPVEKEQSDPVFAGTINEEGLIEVETTKPANDTTLARIIRMVEEAPARKAPSEQWVNRFARYYTPSMMILALAVAIVPPLLFQADWSEWIYEGLVLLVIACPCALVISTPVGIVAGLTAAARAGVLIKGGIYLEMPAHIRVVAFDKTGTLTHGRPQVQTLQSFPPTTDRELIEIAASLESHSDHPLARAIIQRAESDSIPILPASEFYVIKGKGAEGTINGNKYWIGSRRLLQEKIQETSAIREQSRPLEDAGHSIILVGKDDQPIGMLSVADEVRPVARQALIELRKAGVKELVMLTGDNEGTARAIAQEISLDQFRAGLLPEDKVVAVKTLVEKYGLTAMVGDGINDAPAMAQADIGIAMGSAGTDAAIESADVALMTDDLMRIPWLIRHSQRTLRIIKQNIFFSLTVKLLFLLLALIGKATLWMAIAADMGATLLVVFNALRLLQTPTENNANEENKTETTNTDQES